MAGGHASSRVESGSMKFRPGVSIRRPNVPPSPARPTSSGSVLPSTPSKQQRQTVQVTPNHDRLAGSSDTEGGPSRGTIPLVMTRTGPPGISITPGISRVQSRAFQPPRPVDPAHSSLATQPAGSSIIPAPPTKPTGVESYVDGITSRNGENPPTSGSTSGDHSVSLGNLCPANQSASILTPPPSQLQPPHPAPENNDPIPIQPGLPQINTTIGLPTPPATQLAANFPLDPAILEFTNFSQEDEPLPLGIPQLVVEPARELDPAPIPLGMDHMPPPPPLPTRTEPLSNVENVENTAALETLKNSKRGRRVSVKEPKPRKRRKTAKSQDAATQGQEQDAELEQSETKPRRKRSSQKKGRKAMTVEEKIEALEQAAKAAEAEDDEPLDPTTATMASLCDSDITTGRLSSKYLEKGIAYVKHVEERRQRIMERTTERLRKLRQSGLDMDQPSAPPTKKPEPTPAPPEADAEVDEDGNPIAGPSRRRELGASLSPSPEREPQPPEETFVESAAAPQIRFVNGEMVLDEESQFYDRAGPAAQDEDSMVVVDEADSTRFSNSNSFMKKAGSRGSRWTADETELFYWCLSAFGEDYENIARYLGRTPLQCKNKTKSEDRRGNEQRITLAIKTRIPLDLEEFGRITGRDFSGPPPEIRAPVAPPRAENEEQAPVSSSVKAKATSSTPSTTPRKDRKLTSHAEEEIMTLEEYERDRDDD
ncbi:hypothetical protein RSOLAG22IIIB_07933 [Rhizoctonia solani]|uniref:SANT domain-containing protein n=1 Tax=Rhizoctonia solani TaxID=456999 RepID=A0A0K6FR22_9AGAM|nr:hypothetical protein RSOLAG22IIIB_07933 [Rhizoctonia solani]